MKDQQLQKLCSSGQSCHEGTAVSHFAPQPLANLFYLYHSLHHSLTPDDIRPRLKKHSKHWAPSDDTKEEM